MDRDGDFYITWDGKEISSLDDELTEEELKQMDNDAYLDGGPDIIPNWVSKHKADE